MKQSETAGQNQNVGMTTSEKDIDVISAATPEPTWKGKSMFGEKILSKKIYLPVASPIGTAIHTGTEPLFGTAFRVMDIYPGNMQKCDGISLFPTGYKWITMAYECIGLDKRIIFDEANAKLMKNEKITPQERKLLDLVSGLLAEQIEHLPVGYNSDLAACVKALFAPWGRQHGDDAICQTPAPLMASSRKKRLEEAKIPNIDKDAGVIGYDKTVDYKSFLYKEVNKNFGDAAAKGISYLTSAKNGNFETIVSVPFNGVTLSEASVGKNKAQSRNIAACLCLGSMLKNVSNVEKSSCDSNMISPVKLQKIKFRDLLKQCISDLFGKNAASSIEYEFSAKKLKVNADLQFTLDEYNTMYSFRVVGMKSKNEAKEKLAEDAINFIATIKK